MLHRLGETSGVLYSEVVETSHQQHHILALSERYFFLFRQDPAAGSYFAKPLMSSRMLKSQVTEVCAMSGKPKVALISSVDGVVKNVWEVVFSSFGLVQKFIRVVQRNAKHIVTIDEAGVRSTKETPPVDSELCPQYPDAAVPSTPKAIELLAHVMEGESDLDDTFAPAWKNRNTSPHSNTNNNNPSSQAHNLLSVPRDAGPPSPKGAPMSSTPLRSPKGVDRIPATTSQRSSPAPTFLAAPPSPIPQSHRVDNSNTNKLESKNKHTTADVGVATSQHVSPLTIQLQASPLVSNIFDNPSNLGISNPRTLVDQGVDPIVFPTTSGGREFEVNSSARPSAIHCGPHDTSSESSTPRPLIPIVLDVQSSPSPLRSTSIEFVPESNVPTPIPPHPAHSPTTRTPVQEVNILIPNVVEWITPPPVHFPPATSGSRTSESRSTNSVNNTTGSRYISHSARSTSLYTHRELMRRRGGGPQSPSTGFLSNSGTGTGGGGGTNFSPPTTSLLAAHNLSTSQRGNNQMLFTPAPLSLQPPSIQFINWLGSLSMYATPFLNEGIGDPRQLHQLFLNSTESEFTEALHKVGMTKLGHQMLLKAKIEQLNKESNKDK
eukprot:PhF_6_TR12579/c0_g1_i1/m.19774